MPSYVRMFSDGDGNCLPATMRELYWKCLFDHYLLSQTMFLAGASLLSPHCMVAGKSRPGTHPSLEPPTVRTISHVVALIGHAGKQVSKRSPQSAAPLVPFRAGWADGDAASSVGSAVQASSSICVSSNGDKTNMGKTKSLQLVQ